MCPPFAVLAVLPPVSWCLVTERWGLWTGRSSLSLTNAQKPWSGCLQLRPAAPVGAPKESAERVGFPKGLSAQRLLKEVPTPHLWGLRQEKSGAHIRLQMVLCNPSAPKPSWWGFPKVGQYMCGWGGVKKRRWAPRLPQCQVTRGFCA